MCGAAVLGVPTSGELLGVRLPVEGRGLAGGRGFREGGRGLGGEGVASGREGVASAKRHTAQVLFAERGHEESSGPARGQRLLHRTWHRLREPASGGACARSSASGLRRRRRWE